MARVKTTQGIRGHQVERDEMEENLEQPQQPEVVRRNPSRASRAEGSKAAAGTSGSKPSASERGKGKVAGTAKKPGVKKPAKRGRPTAHYVADPPPP